MFTWNLLSCTEIQHLVLTGAIEKLRVEEQNWGPVRKVEAPCVTLSGWDLWPVGQSRLCVFLSSSSWVVLTKMLGSAVPQFNWYKLIKREHIGYSWESGFTTLSVSITRKLLGTLLLYLVYRQGNYKKLRNEGAGDACVEGKDERLPGCPRDCFRCWRSEQHCKEAIESAAGGNACQTAKWVSGPQVSRTSLKPTHLARKTISVIMQKNGVGSHPPSSCLCWRDQDKTAIGSACGLTMWPPCPARHLSPFVSTFLFHFQTTIYEHLCHFLWVCSCGSLKM